MSRSLVEESGMRFIVDSDKLFRVEKVRPAKSMFGVKVAEFAELYSDHLINIIEAKSSSPRPDNTLNFETYIGDIANKLEDTLLLINALRLNRFVDAEMQDYPSAMRHADLSKTMDFHFFLVIKGSQKEWLMPLQNALISRMSTLLQIWNIKSSSVKVINDVMAHDMGIIE